MSNLLKKMKNVLYNFHIMIQFFYEYLLNNTVFTFFLVKNGHMIGMTRAGSYGLCCVTPYRALLHFFYLYVPRLAAVA